jgi:DNA-directed RNA polymerase subunit RPC12/RpoP
MKNMESENRWIMKILRGGFAEEWAYVCPKCGCTVSEKSGLGKYQGHNQQLNFCPNCGAKMDGGNEDV